MEQPEQFHAASIVHRINVSPAAYALNSFLGVRSEATEWRKDDSSVMWEGRGGEQQF